MKPFVGTLVLTLILVSGLLGQNQEPERPRRPARRERAPRGERTMRARPTPAGLELLVAVEAGDWEKVKASLQADPTLVSAMDRIGRSPLYMAAWGGHKEITELLLASGAEIDGEADKSQSTPLVDSHALAALCLAWSCARMRSVR